MSLPELSHPVTQSDVISLTREFAMAAVRLRDTGSLDQARGVAQAHLIFSHWWEALSKGEPTELSHA